MYSLTVGKKSCQYILIALLSTSAAYASCNIINATNQSDPIHEVLVNADSCPRDVLSFRKAIIHSGLKTAPTMVANRGFHNPKLGSFSIFEIVSGKGVSPGEFFFGHFTTAKSNTLILDQDPTKNSLMIEAFAWDTSKKLFNFYELRGNGEQGQWFYRGDSADIYADNRELYLQNDPSHPKFGNRLRCSACHGAGGPIMKELKSPHNDWWSEKYKIKLGSNKPSRDLRVIMEQLVPAKHLAESVKLGIKKLLSAGQPYKLSLRQQLRPLFCPTEINIESDTDSNRMGKDSISIPKAFFLDDAFNTNNIKIKVKRSDYNTALNKLHSKFPETALIDADHAWLTPVKGYADAQIIQGLIRNHIISKKHAMDILSIDMLNPVFSSKRCHLLKYVPVNYSQDWMKQFKNNLHESQDTDAHLLFNRIINTKFKPSYYQKKAKKILNQCQIQLRNKDNVLKMVKLLSQRRHEVSDAELSKNPRGQILEPGFRVIFPTTNTKPISGRFRLTEKCEVIDK